MALESYLFDVSCKAENDLSAKQFYAVELSGADRQVDVCDNAGDLVFGILQNKPTASKAATVRVGGITKWISDGSGTPINVGAKVGTDGSGKAVVKTADTAKVAGTALSASSADGTIIDVLLTPNTMIAG